MLYDKVWRGGALLQVCTHPIYAWLSRRRDQPGGGGPPGLGVRLPVTTEGWQAVDAIPCSMLCAQIPLSRLGCQECVACSEDLLTVLSLKGCAFLVFRGERCGVPFDSLSADRQMDCSLVEHPESVEVGVLCAMPKEAAAHVHEQPYSLNEPQTAGDDQLESAGGCLSSFGAGRECWYHRAA